MPVLDNWSLVQLSHDPYQPPECRGQGLHGKVTGSEKFENGAEITTTQIVGLEELDGIIAVKTASGSEYVLAFVDPGYEAAYPGAKKRLLAAWSRA